MSSIISLLLLFVGAHFVQNNGVPVIEYLYLIPLAAFTSLFPVLVAKFLKSGRTAVQIMFGLMLCPLIAGIFINIMVFFK